MPNIDDYLLWRGDLSFDVDPFNEVDAAVLCQLAYTDFDDVVNGMDFGEPKPLEVVEEAYFASHTDEEIMARKTFTKTSPFLMRKMVNSRRFAGITLSDYVDEVSLESNVQLSAVTYHINGFLFVAYRGTDSTLAGWKEDLMMSYRDHTNGQKAALLYLENTAEKYPDEKEIMIGGHSKGGNLAMYASAFCSEETKRRISQIYNLDGPGFTEEVTDSEGYLSILKKISSYSPSISIVGALLERKYPMKYISSNGKFIMQHDLVTWQVLGRHFVPAENRANSSLLIEDVLDRWLTSMDDDARQSFVNTVFDILANTDIETFPEITDDMLSNIRKMYAAAASMPKEQRKESFSAFLNMIKIGGLAALTGK